MANTVRGLWLAITLTLWRAGKTRQQAVVRAAGE